MLVKQKHVANIPAPPLGPKKGTYSCSTFHEKKGSFLGRSAIRVFVKKDTFSRQKFAISEYAVVFILN